ncbi:hypothetical protein [Agrobacterium sp. NPDC090283]|uniref:hypothetical protein n=1 Tax=Agrobacterium sp. NPDC090283 TaxID=3363920 RepID=UPI00383AF929
MAQMTLSQTTSSANRDPLLSEYAEKLINYSKEYHLERPTASLAHCMEMGAGKLVGEYGDDKDHLAQLALSEVAAKYVFG